MLQITPNVLPQQPVRPIPQQMPLEVVQLTTLPNAASIDEKSGNDQNGEESTQPTENEQFMDEIETEFVVVDRDMVGNKEHNTDEDVQHEDQDLRDILPDLRDNQTL